MFPIDLHYLSAIQIKTMLINSLIIIIILFYLNSGKDNKQIQEFINSIFKIKPSESGQ